MGNKNKRSEVKLAKRVAHWDNLPKRTSAGHDHHKPGSQKRK